MDCDQVRRDELIEKYLAGTLPEAERDAFEEHFFECEDCFAEIENLRALQAELAGTRETIEAEAPGRVTPWRRNWVVGLAAAAVLVIGLAALLLGPWRTPVGPPAVSAELGELARIEPPAYAPVRLRGATDEAQRQFREAMGHYTVGDFAAAIPGLEAAAKLDPEAPNISFFLGACYLLTSQEDTGIPALEHVVALGDTPFLEEALLLLAKTHLSRGEVDTAMEFLLNLAALNGDLEPDARHLIEQLRTFGATSL